MKKILIVEDEDILREAYEIILQKQGYKVTTARDGKEGLKELSNQSPDLLLLDLLMPNVDGVEFLRRANLKSNHPDTHVIAFSNLSDSGRLDLAIKLGATNHILKSSKSPKELVEYVVELLEKKDPKTTKL